MYKKDKIEYLAKSLQTNKVAIYLETYLTIHSFHIFHSKNRYGIKKVHNAKRWSCGICMRIMREIF